MKMMASLLASRFRLRFHLEKKQLPVYASSVDRAGSKLKQSGDGPHGPEAVYFRDRGHLVATNANIADLAWELQSALVDRSVVDRTGLGSRFDFTLTWTPDEFQKNNFIGSAQATAEAPILFTAIHQQVGLKLEAIKASVDVMVVDQVEQPWEN